MLAVLAALVPGVAPAAGAGALPRRLWLVATPDRLDLWTAVAAGAPGRVHLACTLLATGRPALPSTAGCCGSGGAGAGCAAAVARVWLLAARRGLVPGPAAGRPALAAALGAAARLVRAGRAAARGEDDGGAARVAGMDAEEYVEAVLSLVETVPPAG